MNIFIEQSDPRLVYAKKELIHFLNKYTVITVSSSAANAAAVVSLAVDPGLEPHVYSLEGDGRHLNIKGGNPSSVLCGVYEALGDAGIFFEANGDCLPREFDVTRFLSENKTVSPKCRRRGIRQHLNFPMDISSYSLKDAKEYIRAIARMRFNAITFHSYAEQWHVTNPLDKNSSAGLFFYGQQHFVPDNELAASRINNKYRFCIPEVEAIFDDKAAKSDFAISWLKEVINTAKEAYMEVTVSVELRSDEEDVIVAMLKGVAESYSNIDVLELITHECGATARIKDLTAENAVEKLVELFGKKILSPDGTLEGFDGTLPDQLGGGAGNLKRILTAIENKDKWYSAFGENAPVIRVGMYIPDVPSLRVLRPMVDKLFPADLPRCLLPAYRSVDTAEVMEELDIQDEEWQNTMFYSWIEFDGDMFYQQMGTRGLSDMICSIKPESVYGICANHWRTAENATCISYLSDALITPVTAADFFVRYANRLGIGDAEGFRDACLRVSNIDLRKLWGPGFCFVGCWYNGDQTVNGVVRPWLHLDQSSELAIYTEGEFMSLSKAFEDLVKTALNPDAIWHLRLLSNRCKTSAVYMESMCRLSELNKIYDYIAQPVPTKEELEKITEVIETSRRLATEYMDLYGEMLPDRGCEGVLASHWISAFAFIDKVASHFEGYQKTEEFSSPDAPPAPAANDAARNEA